MATTESTPAQTEPAVQPTSRQVVNQAIARVVEATGIDVQKSHYKAMRAIAWQAFVEAIEAGDFDALVKRAITHAGSLPMGWEIEVPAKPSAVPTPVKKVNASKTATR